MRTNDPNTLVCQVMICKWGSRLSGLFILKWVENIHVTFAIFPLKKGKFKHYKNVKGIFKPKDERRAYLNHLKYVENIFNPFPKIKYRCKLEAKLNNVLLCLVMM